MKKTTSLKEILNPSKNSRTQQDSFTLRKKALKKFGLTKADILKIKIPSKGKK